ncbi:membrane protein [Terasakiella brassicae]|uniref:Membrane protein n=1 Tax=Terasakiella brassicae TaxID=1634917 RepID=A0A917C3T1_9PROT|nr:EamA family transporter [Terasakiella brassicae]GGF69395.1 membrane protein [Terasakiella brassicae]
MPNAFLYITTVLIWGSTWLAIKYQLGVVAVEASIAYRFALASILLLAFCVLTRRSLAFDRKTHIWFALLGLCLFSGNYFFMYIASGHITTGLVSVGFCSMVVMNIILSRLFFKTSISGRVVLGATLGMVGTFMVFWPEVKHFDPSDSGFYGMTLVLLGTLCASFGNMVSARNQKKGVPVMQANAWGMAYGALFMAIFASFNGVEFTFDPRFEYIWSLFYLAVFGSVIAFGCYLTLLGNIGPEKAVYSVVLFPIVALSLSTVFEGYHWPMAAVVGVPLVLFGNVLVLTKLGTFRKVARV